MKKRFAAVSSAEGNSSQPVCHQCGRLAKRNEELERKIRSLGKQFRRLTHRIADLEGNNSEVTLELEADLKQLEVVVHKQLEEASSCSSSETASNLVTIVRHDGVVVKFARNNNNNNNGNGNNNSNINTKRAGRINE
jgi:type II secretory pathway component PulJ